MGRRIPPVRLRVLALCLLVLLALPAAAAASVEQGTISPNRGAAGITLGLTRAQVVAKLGKPLYENSYGYMQYSRNNLFDLYRRGGVVDLIGISGPKFCLKGGICVLKRVVPKLKAKFGSRLAFEESTEDGTQAWIVHGRYLGRGVFTSFEVDGRSDHARLIMVWIGFDD